MKGPWLTVVYLLTLGTAQAVTIDEFDGVQGPLTPSGTAQSSATDAAIIGGERDLLLSSTSLGANAFVNNGIFQFDNGADTQASMHFQWDGADNSQNLDVTGLGGVDLTAGNTTDAFEIVVLFDDLPATIDLTVHTDGANASSVSWPTTGLLLTGDTAISIFIPFAAFSGSADFTNVGAIEMSLTATATAGLDIQLDRIGTALAPVPLPPAIWMFASALLGLAVRRRN